jgi:choline monooxygenase
MELDVPLQFTPDASWYTDEGQFAREQKYLFLKQWHFFRELAAFDKAGDTVAQMLLDRPVLVRRSSDGTIRGFHNVCRHRGGALVRDGESNCGSLKCLYHGWSYDDAGRLLRTPRFSESDEPHFNYEDYPLYTLGVEQWKGLVFITFDPDAPSLSATIGDLPELLGTFDATGFDIPTEKTYRFACNWKIYVENWLESYHFPWLHPSLTKDVDVSEYAISIRNRVVKHSALRRKSDSVYDGLWLWLAPNLSWNFYDNGFSLERMMPVGPHATDVRYTFFFRRGTSDGARRDALEMCEKVTREDGDACEAVYRNLLAGIFRRGPLSPRHETAISYFHAFLREAVDKVISRDQTSEYGDSQC